MLNILGKLIPFTRQVYLVMLCALYSVLSFSQNFPVQVIPQTIPPAPIYVSNYADASTLNGPLRVQIILNDFDIANREIRLKTYFTGSGLSFQSNDMVVGASPLFLEGGVPLVLTQVELAPYFDFNNITGISPNQYGNAIPEGAYQFCVEVYDVLTGSRLSNKSCAVNVVFQNEPPFLVLPRSKTNVDEVNPQYIVFQWTPRSINVSNVEYELSLVEIWDTQVDPQQAFLSSPPVFQTTTSATTYVYGPADPLLLSGKNYAWRVQAKAKQGTEEIGLFKNQGYSEIFSFSYAGSCDLPLVVNHEVKGSTNANIFWDDFSTEIPEFTVRYRQKNVQDAEWFLAKTTFNELTIWDLKAGTTYEYQLSKNCDITQSEWSFTKEFTTALEFEEESVLDCGVSPDINLTNMQPLASIGSGATFKAGDFPVKILEVSGSNGRFTGKGYVTLPYLKNIKVAVEFTNILINTDKEMAEGSVRTAYDADWGNILDTGDVTDVLDDVGDVFTGGDNVDYEVDFEINSVNDIKIEDGKIIITGPNGETKTLDHDDGDTYQIKDASGDTYNIDEDGNITKGAEAAEGGEATAQNTDGISGGNGTADAPSVNEITANGITVTFKRLPNTKYDLDIADSDFERSKYPKAQTSNGTDYYPVHKAVVDGQTEEFLAEISISNSNISIDDLIFKTVSGSKIDTRKEGNSNIIISLNGVNSYRSEEAIVAYKDENGKYKIAASFFIHHIKQQELVNVVVVSVNGTTQLSNLEQELNTIYGKAGAQFKVSTDTFSLQASDWDDNSNGKLDYDGSGLLSDYPQELKNIQQKYKQNNPSWDAKAYHLFLLPNNMSLTKPLSGFMPKTRQWGYIFNAHTDDALENKSSQNLVAAHELGHGVFKLPHPFQNDENKSGSGSNWLMDYNDGDQLPYAHWAAMSDESLQLFLFQDEEDSEYTDGLYFEKLLQQIRCAYIDGENTIPLPEKYRSNALDGEVFKFEYGFSVGSGVINGDKISLASVKTENINTISGITSPKFINNSQIEFNGLTIKFTTPSYSVNNGVSPWEHLKSYLFPKDEETVKEEYSIVLNQLLNKTTFTDDDIKAIKRIANCSARYFSTNNKYLIISKIANNSFTLTEYYEDLILDLLENYNGDVLTYSNELIKLLNEDPQLLRRLFNKIDDENGAVFWKGNEDNFTRFLDVLYGLWKRSNYDNKDNYSYLDVGETIGATVFSPEFISYDGKSWFPTVTYSDISFKQGNFTMNSKTIYGNYGRLKYDFFQPVYLGFVKGNNKVKLTKVSVPAIYFAGTVKKDNLEKSLDQIGLTIDVALTLSAIGNVAKLRHLSTLQRIGRVTLASVEVTSGFADIMVRYTDLCEGNEDFCNAFQEYNTYLQLGLLSSGLIRAKFKSTRNTAKEEYIKQRDVLINKYGESNIKINELDVHFGLRNTSIQIPASLANKLGDQVDKLSSWLARYGDKIGSDANRLLQEVETLIDNKSIIKVFDQGVNGEVFIQITRADKTNSVVTIQKTAATHPIHKGKYIATKYEPAYKLDANLDYTVPLSKNGITPDYATTSYMHPRNKGKTIRIEMTGSRSSDFIKADVELKKVSSYSGNRDTFTWHHMDDYYYDAVTGKSYCTMQLVETEVHGAQGMTHSGSVAQMEKFTGITYK